MPFTLIIVGALMQPAQKLDLQTVLARAGEYDQTYQRDFSLHAALHLPRRGAQRGDGPEPFEGINPCGYVGLATVDLSRLGISTDWDTVAGRLGDKLASHLSP